MILVILAVVLVFATVALLIYGMISQRQAGSDPVAARLAEIKSSTESTAWWQQRRTQRRPFLERFLARLAGFLPNADGQESIKDGLTEAGPARTECGHHVPRRQDRVGRRACR